MCRTNLYIERKAYGIYDSRLLMTTGWVSEVRRGGNGVKIVPRLLFEGWSMASYKAMFASEENMKKVAKFIVSNLRVRIKTISVQLFIR